MRTIVFSLLICFAQILGAQPLEVDRAFLTVMVIPYTGAADSSARSAIEKNDACRAVIGQINQVFEERGYRTKDYMAILRLPNIAPEASDLERTEIKEAIKNAKVDVVVYTEIRFRNFSEGDRQLQLRLQAIDQYSAENYANNISIESTRRRYQDFVQAAKEAQLVSQLKGFADQLDRKFVDLLKNGRTSTIRVKALPSSKVKLGSLVDGSLIDLAGTLNKWVQHRANRIYPSASDNDLWEIECKIPVVDEQQRTVTPFSFRTELKAYLQQLRFAAQPLKIKDVAVINSVIEIILE